MGVPYISGVSQYVETENIFSNEFAFSGGNIYIGDNQSKISFFGNEPISQQTLANDNLSSVVSALKAYGIIK